MFRCFRLGLFIFKGKKGEHQFQVKLRNEIPHVKLGMRICQIIIRKLIDYEFKVVRELSKSERGKNGFGSKNKL